MPRFAARSVVVATLVVLAAALFTLPLAGCGEAVSGTDPKGASPETEWASTLFLAGDGEMWVVDVNAERAEHLRMPDQLAAGDPPHRIAAIGDRLALWSYDVTSVPIADPTAPSSTLAEDGWIFIPAADPARIWVGFLDRDHPPRERPLGELREIDSSANVITRVKPPGGAWPYAELTSGLIFQMGGSLELWDPDDQRTVRTYPWEQIGDMGPVSGDLLASCIESCEGLILTDFATGEQRQIPAPRGLAFAVPEASFSLAARPSQCRSRRPEVAGGHGRPMSASWPSFRSRVARQRSSGIQRSRPDMSSPPGRPMAVRYS